MKYGAKILLIVSVVILFLLALTCGAFFLSFKTRYKDIVLANSESTGVDASLIFSVIKAESKFDANAKSSAGALGLMQVMLSTANYILLQNGEYEIAESDLFVPETNIKVGTMYLKYLMEKFSNLDVVICAYNAGETVVAGWLKNKDYSDDGQTLNKIPYSETNTYLHRVKFNMKIYSKFL